MLLYVNFEDAGRRRGSAWPTGVVKLLMIGQRFLQPMLDLVPGTLVERFFLAPYDLLDVPVLFNELCVLVDRKRV